MSEVINNIEFTGTLHVMIKFLPFIIGLFVSRIFINLIFRVLRVASSEPEEQKNKPVSLKKEIEEVKPEVNEDLEPEEPTAFYKLNGVWECETNGNNK